jgi:hypothetical protein
VSSAGHLSNERGAVGVADDGVNIGAGDEFDAEQVSDSKAP